MLKIGKLTDYAMLIMSEMAKDAHAVSSATYLAEQLHLSPPTVSKVLKMLSDAGLVNSIRGAVGGYHLARAAEAITIIDIINAMEGELAMTECCDRAGVCPIDSMCTLRENWQKINNTIYSFLAGFSIKDLLHPLVLKPILQGVEDGK